MSQYDYFCFSFSWELEKSYRFSTCRFVLKTHTFLRYHLDTESCMHLISSNIMSLGINTYQWSYHHSLCHNHIYHLQKWWHPSLLLPLFFVIKTLYNQIYPLRQIRYSTVLLTIIPMLYSRLSQFTHLVQLKFAAFDYNTYLLSPATYPLKPPF